MDEATTERNANRVIYGLYAKYAFVLFLVGVFALVTGFFLRDSESHVWTQRLGYWLVTAGLPFAAGAFVFTILCLLDREAARRADGWQHRYPHRYRILFWSLALLAAAIFVAALWYTTSHGLTTLS